MPGATSASSEVQVIYAKLTRFATGISNETAQTLRLALTSAQQANGNVQQNGIKTEPMDTTGPDEPIPSTSGEAQQNGEVSASTPVSTATPTVTFAPETRTFPAVGDRRTLGGATGAPSATVVVRFGGPQPLGPDDIPGQPAHPTDPEEIRRLMRRKMHRCRKCKNRFTEKNLLERHLRDRHEDIYIHYMEEQAREIAAQRKAEIEQSKREEILCGGFIPPADDIDALLNFADLDPTDIPMPGEETGGVPPTFDEWGGVRMRMPPRKFPYKKKVSPQCPFCDKRFNNEVSLKKHVAKKHPDNVDFVQCTNCYKCLQNAEKLPKDQHECELAWICFQCVPMKNMCTQQRLDLHRSKFHRGQNSGFRCNDCSRKFLTPRKLRKHKKMAHVITKPFKCNFCDEYFPTDTQVSLHERIHTGKIKYECSICDFRTNRWPKLETHKKEEHGYLCSICHQKMSEWSELKYHTLENHGGYLSSESQAVCIESPRVWVVFKGE